MPIRLTAMPLGRTASLIASVPMSTPCEAAFWRAAMAASSTGLGAGCQSRAPCMQLSPNAHNAPAGITLLLQRCGWCIDASETPDSRAGISCVLPY